MLSAQEPLPLELPGQCAVAHWDSTHLTKVSRVWSFSLQGRGQSSLATLFIYPSVPYKWFSVCAVT